MTPPDRTCRHRTPLRAVVVAGLACAPIGLRLEDATARAEPRLGRAAAVAGVPDRAPVAPSPGGAPLADPPSGGAAPVDPLPGRAASGPPPPQVPGGWGWPLAGWPRVTRPFHLGPTRYSAGHRGVDLAGAVGEPVRSAAAGHVAFAGSLAGRGVLVVVHGSLRTTYEPVTTAVPVGTAVRRGEAVGRLDGGHAGCPVAACLHWGLLRGREYLDPLSVVGARLRLLPVGAGAGALDRGRPNPPPAGEPSRPPAPAAQPPSATSAAGAVSTAGAASAALLAGGALLAAGTLRRRLRSR